MVTWSKREGCSQHASRTGESTSRRRQARSRAASALGVLVGSAGSSADSFSFLREIGTSENEDERC